MSDWVGIFIILISLFCGGFALGVKWGEPMLDSSKALPPTQSDVPDTNVKDMISRQAAIKAFKNFLTIHDSRGVEYLCSAVTMDGVNKILFNLPSVDAVEVVRCKDCKHSTEWYRDKRRCFLWCEEGIDVFEDGYCNYGEQKGDEQNDG